MQLATQPKVAADDLGALSNSPRAYRIDDQSEGIAVGHASMVPHHGELVSVAEMAHTNYKLSLRVLGSSGRFGRQIENTLMITFYENFMKTVL